MLQSNIPANVRRWLYIKERKENHPSIRITIYWLIRFYEIPEVNMEIKNIFHEKTCRYGTSRQSRWISWNEKIGEENEILLYRTGTSYPCEKGEQGAISAPSDK